MKNGRVAACGKPNEVFTKERISDTYNFPCTICKNPVNDTPMIIFG